MILVSWKNIGIGIRKISQNLISEALCDCDVNELTSCVCVKNLTHYKRM